MANNNTFIKKWDGRTLQDDGIYVSKEFHSFQVAFMNAIKKIASEIGAEVVNNHYGHYDVCGFIKRGDKFVYFEYSNACGFGGRTHIILSDNYAHSKPMMLRTAKDEKDYCGNVNHFCHFDKWQEMAQSG